MLVNYDGKFYPDEIMRFVSGEVEINSMAYTSVPGCFKLPKDSDIHRYPIEDVERKLTKPEPCDNRAVSFFFFQMNHFKSPSYKIY